MKKSIVFMLLLISNIAYSQTCPVMHTKSDSIVGCKLKIKNLTNGIAKFNSLGNASIATGADLPTMTSTASGAVPTPPNDATKFLNGAGAFTIPTGTGGTVTTVSVATANGVSGSISNPTTTPAITLTLGAITPSTVNGVTLSGSSTPTLAVTGTTSISGTHSGTSSGTNTGDQTSVTGNAGTATALQTPRAINGTNFDGTAPITVTAVPSGSARGDLTGTYPNPTLLLDRMRALTPTTVKTTTYSAAANDFVPCDNTSGSFTITLPNAPADKTVFGAKMVIQGGTNTITITCSGSDVFNKAGGSTSGTLSYANQCYIFQYKASSGIWYLIADDLPKAALDAIYQPLTTNGSHWASIDTSAKANVNAQNISKTGTTATFVMQDSPIITTQAIIPTLYGSSASGGSLQLNSTSNATKGFIYLSTGSGYDATKQFLGIGTQTPAALIHMAGNISANAWTTSGIRIRAAGATYTDNTSATGTVSQLTIDNYGVPTVNSSNTVTYTSAYGATWNAPTATGNATITTAYAGNFQGNLLVSNTLLLQGSLSLSGVAINMTGGSKTIGTTDANAVAIKTNNANRILITSAGLTGIGPTAPTATAYLHLAAGTTAASTSPLKFTSGTSMTASEAGAMEFATDDLFFTITTGAARKNIVLSEANLVSARIPFATTNGRQTDDASLVYSTSTGITTTKNITVPHLIGQTGTPTIAAGTGAGTSPTVSVTGTDLGGYISVTTGTLPTLAAAVVTITFNTAFGVAPRCISLSSANSNTSTLSGVSMVYVNQAGITTTTFAITAGATALTAATAYQWYYQVIQ